MHCLGAYMRNIYAQELQYKSKSKNMMEMHNKNPKTLHCIMLKQILKTVQVAKSCHSAASSRKFLYLYRLGHLTKMVCVNINTK